MNDAVIVSTARTPIGKAYKGGFNATKSPTMMAHALRHAVERAQLQEGEIDDVVVGTVLSSGTAGMNLARNAALAAGLGHTAAGQTIDRQCASGLMAIAIGAKQIMVDGMQIVVAGGQENISAEQQSYFDAITRNQDPNVIAQSPHAYMPMLHTAEYVARRYGITREMQDIYALESQQRTAAAQQAGRFDAEIVPLEVTKRIADRDGGPDRYVSELLTKDEGNRPETTIESLQRLAPVV
ncbi:MAG TPA: acetyl-CoA C-acyltransferase, partial [Eoetvoesiella sp.]